MELHLLVAWGQGPGALAVVGAMALLLIAMALASVRLRVLTPMASLLAAVVGLGLLFVGGAPYLAIILFFVVTSAFATRYRIDEKRERAVAEGKEGERGVPNVLAHAIVPAGLVLLLAIFPLSGLKWGVPFLYTCAIAFGAADTFASEIGVLSGRAVSILGFRSVPAGTNGGVSPEGELAALFATLITALFGVAMFLGNGTPLGMPLAAWIVGVTLLGWIGCQVDSLLGATLENRGLLGKGLVNLLSMTATTVLAAGVLEVFLWGGWLP